MDVELTRLTSRTSCFFLPHSLPAATALFKTSALQSPPPVGDGLWHGFSFRERCRMRNEAKSQLSLHDGCFPSQSVRRSHSDGQDANCKSLWNVMTGRHVPTDETSGCWRCICADRKQLKLVLFFRNLVSVGKYLLSAAFDLSSNYFLDSLLRLATELVAWQLTPVCRQQIKCDWGAQNGTFRR